MSIHSPPGLTFGGGQAGIFGARVRVFEPGALVDPGLLPACPLGGAGGSNPSAGGGVVAFFPMWITDPPGLIHGPRRGHTIHQVPLHYSQPPSPPSLTPSPSPTSHRLPDPPPHASPPLPRSTVIPSVRRGGDEGRGKCRSLFFCFLIDVVGAGETAFVFGQTGNSVIFH